MNANHPFARSRRWLAALLVLAALLPRVVHADGARDGAAGAALAAPELPWTLVASHPHDPRRFTQGLEFRDGLWLESSGGFGRSFVLLERAAAEAPEALLRLPPHEFAEGASFAGRHVWLLTWRAGVARKLDRQLQEVARYRYHGEGWGLTWDGERLIMSDGSDRLQLRSGEDFRLLGELRVRDGLRRVGRLNELEYAHGLIWANVFGSRRIAAIDPDSGRVRGWLALDELPDFPLPPGWDAANNVLNGIAIDGDSGHLHLTGKRWPRRYEIRLGTELTEERK